MPANVSSANAYEILGVPRDAAVPAIRQAFRKLALKYHPDAVPADEKAQAAAVFAKINQAHELLRDPDKRRKYDALLDRGITPDISREVGAIGGFSSLGEILGEIQGLKIESKPPLNAMDGRLRQEMLLANLIRTNDACESVIDLLKISAITALKNFEVPQGKLTESWLAVTELRLTVLLKYVHEYQQGNTKYTNTYWRARSFGYLSLKKMAVHEVGRAFTSYFIELEDEDNTYFKLSLGSPNLTPLFLVVNTFKLPLKIETKADKGEEYAGAVGGSLVGPLFLWSLPFVCSSLCNVFSQICSKAPDKRGVFENYGSILEWMNEHWLTTILVYGAPLLMTILWLGVFRAWNVGMAEAVIGELPADFARGGPELDEALQKHGLLLEQQRKPAPAPVPEPVKKAPPRQPPAKKPPQHRPPPEAIPASAGPADVEMPEAIRQALGLPDVPPPPAPQPSAPQARPKVNAFCTHCGQKYTVPAGTRGSAACKKCGHKFRIEV